MYTYKRTEFSPELYTVGYNDQNTGWEPESDHETREGAAQRTAFLNGNSDLETARRLEAAEARIAELEKMRNEALLLGRSVLETNIFCQSDWIGLLEVLEHDEADYHTYAEGVL